MISCPVIKYRASLTCQFRRNNWMCNSHTINTICSVWSLCMYVCKVILLKKRKYYSLSLIYQCLYSPILGPGRLFRFVIRYTVCRTPWTGDQPVARPIPAHRTTQTQNKHTHTSVIRVGNYYSCVNILKIIGRFIMCRITIQLVYQTFMRVEVFKAVKIYILVFLVMTPCKRVFGYQSLEGRATSIFSIGTRFLRNFSKHFQVYTVS
jgi:hypothetical protein